MNAKLYLKFFRESYRSIACAILLGAAILNVSGYVPFLFSGSDAPAGKSERFKINDDSTRLPIKNGEALEKLAGKWQRKQSYGNSYANYAIYAGRDGNFESYEIRTDGSVRRESLILTRFYDCPVDIVDVSEGILSVSSDSELNISLKAGTIQRDDSCFPENDYTYPAEATSTDFQYQVGVDEYGARELCLTNPAGEKVCYRRVK